MAQLLISEHLVNGVFNHPSLKDRPPKEKLVYVQFADAAIWTIASMLNHDVSWTIVENKRIRTARQKLRCLPFMDDAFSLRIELSPSDHITNYDDFLLRVIISVFGEYFRPSSEVELDDLREQFLMSLNRPIAAAFIAFAFDNETKIPIDDGVVSNILATLETLAAKRYEGQPSEINLIVNPQLRPNLTSDPNTKPKFDNHFLALKKTGTVFSGHRVVVECDITGTVHGVDELPLWSLGKNSPMRLCPYEYQSVFHRIGQINAMSFILNRHGEIIVATGNEMLMMQVNGMWTLCRTGYAHDRLVSALRSMSHLPLRVARSITMIFLMLALSLRHRRKGGLIVVCKTQADAAALVGKSRRSSQGVAEQFIHSVFEDRFLFDIPFGVLMNGLAFDGATLVTPDSKCRAIGVVVNTSRHRSQSEGARTRAAEFASKNGIAIKISEDGPISIYVNGTHEFDVIS